MNTNLKFWRSARVFCGGGIRALALCAVAGALSAPRAAVAADPAAEPEKTTVAAVGGERESRAAGAVARAADWLVARQRPDGSFSNSRFPGLTAIALWALEGANDAKYADSIRHASDFILSCVQPDGGIYRPVPGRVGGGLSTYNTALCLTALSFCGRDDIDRVVLDARTFLADSQLKGDDEFAGGFGYDKSAPKRYADLNNTAFVIEAMRRTQGFEDRRPAGERKADLDWAAALAFAESLHNGSDAGDSAGGFAYSPADAKAGTEKTESGKSVLRSYGSITYSGLLSLVYCNLDRTDPRVRSAVDWTARHWTLDENPGVGDQGLYFFYDIVSRALSAAGLDLIPRVAASGDASSGGPEAGDGPIDWRAEMIDKVVSLQREDGSFVNTNGRFWENDPVLCTSYSAISLAFAAGLMR